MVIYLDVIWLLNFCFDLLLLLLTAFILKRQVKTAIYVRSSDWIEHCSLALYTICNVCVTPSRQTAFSVLIVLATFGFQRFRFFFKTCLLLLCHIFDGRRHDRGSFVLQTNTVIQDGLLISQNDGFGDPISWLFVLTGFPAIWLFSKKRLGEVGAKKTV